MKRVTSLPDDASLVGFVSALELNRPMDLGGLSPPRFCNTEDEEQPVNIEQLLPIRISGLIEPESKKIGSRGRSHDASGL